MITRSVDPCEMEMKVSVMAMTSQQPVKWFQQLYSKSPTWFRLLRFFAWLNRFKMYLLIMNNQRDGSLDVGFIKSCELERSVKDIVRLVQNESFSWSGAFSDDGVTYKSQELRRLKPRIVEGVMYLGGRVNSTLMILPAKSHVTDLIVEHYHKMNSHAGPTQCLAAIRRDFWVVHGMTTVKRVVSRCAKCRITSAPFCQQMMSPLPHFRTDVGTYAFQHSGVDYFGPFYVKIGRSNFKRFGCLFTCMQVRAIHIEVCHDMSTDSFLMALSRFISRRGAPVALYSDNGSNFIGAEVELRKLIRTLDQGRIVDGLSIQKIEWNFGPPYASHRGGVWERMIKSVRKILNSIMLEQTMTEEVLLTSLAEAERVVNDRPLVPVYDDPEQPEGLAT